MIKTALITGGNSGIGFKIAERLLEADGRMNVCLGCRNEKRASKAVSVLRTRFPAACVDFVLIDVSMVDSVLEAAAELKARYSHIDLIYLNAGILPVSHIDWAYFFKNLFSSNCANMFTTGDGLLLQHNHTTKDGLKNIFATNIKELSYIIGGDLITKIIWTSSSNAKKSNFSISDIQHKKGRDPYSSSKYLMDVLTVAFNVKFNDNNIFCYTTCPGLVITNLSMGILPCWFWRIFMPILYLMRIIVPTLTYTALNGSEAAIWLSEHNPVMMNFHYKYVSNVSIRNIRTVKEVPLCISEEVSMQAFNVLSELEKIANENISNQ